MENTIKLLCTEQEAHALLELLPTDEFIKMVKDDPEWGIDGSGEYYVVYIDNRHNYFSHSFAFRYGVLVQQKIANK